MDAKCAICNEEFDDDERIPRLLPTCGLSYCQKCIIQAQQQPDCCFQCPIDNQAHSLAYDPDALPINIALIKTLGDLKNIQHQKSLKQIKNISTKSLQIPFPLIYSTQSFINGTQKCSIHNKKIQFRCLQDNQAICSHCILFGEHQNHQIQNINKVAAIQSKQRMEMMFQQVVSQMGDLDHNIKQFLEPPNSFNKNIQNLKKSLKYEIKRTFKTYHQIINQKEQQLEKQVDNIIKHCEGQMQQIQNQLNVQYSTICCIKQQINTLKIDLNNSNQYGVGSFSEKKIEDLLHKIHNTSQRLITMNQQIMQKCNQIEIQYKQKINNRQFVKIKQMNIALIDDDENDNEQDGDQVMLLQNNTNLLEKSKSFDSRSSQNNFNIRKDESTTRNTCFIKTHKPSMFATKTVCLENLPQASFLKPPVLQNFRNRTNTIIHFKKPSQIQNNKQQIPSPTKTLTRYNSGFLQNASMTSSVFYSRSPDSMINRSKIQSIKDQQQRRQSGKQEVRKKVSKILQSIQSQNGTTLQLIEIKDYFINQIFNYIKNSNRKYGLMKLVKNEITDEGFYKILNYLKDYQYIHTLNMTSNCLTQQCLESIIEFSQYNKSLRNFYLKNNQINYIRTKQIKQQISDLGINLYY